MTILSSVVLIGFSRTMMASSAVKFVEKICMYTFYTHMPHVLVITLYSALLFASIIDTRSELLIGLC